MGSNGAQPVPRYVEIAEQVWRDVGADTYLPGGRVVGVVSPAVARARIRDLVDGAEAERRHAVSTLILAPGRMASSPSTTRWRSRCSTSPARLAHGRPTIWRLSASTTWHRPTTEVCRSQPSIRRALRSGRPPRGSSSTGVAEALPGAS